jgi:anti-anti-sigma regulatory factor
MRRRLLVISKEPEFDSHGEVVYGQCEPFTSGWGLVMILPDSQRETLLVGAYADLRKVQESCAGLDEPAAVRKRVADMRAFLAASVTETVVAPMDRPGGGTTETREMPAVLPKRTPGGLLDLVPSGRVVIATVVQPERAEDENYFRTEVLALLDWHPRAVLMDLGKVSNLPPGCLKELAGARDRLREAGADLALCNLTLSMRQRVQTLKPRELLPVFENQESGLQALKA